jgi:hypothetical protein
VFSLSVVVAPSHWQCLSPLFSLKLRREFPPPPRSVICLVPRLLGQWQLGSPFLFPRHTPIPALACYLLAHLYRPSLSPLLTIDFPCGSLCFPSCLYTAGCFRLASQSAATCSRWFLAHGFFYPEDGGDTFLWNVGSNKNLTAPHPRKRHSSVICLVHALGWLDDASRCTTWKGYLKCFLAVFYNYAVTSACNAVSVMRVAEV